jgi:hypothetical protein
MFRAKPGAHVMHLDPKLQTSQPYPQVETHWPADVNPNPGNLFSHFVQTVELLQATQLEMLH